jgi:hypothetical protein
MNAGLKKLWDRGGESISDFAEQVGATSGEIMQDFRELRADYKVRIDELFREWSEDETAYELFEGFLRASGKGWKAAEAYLRRKHDGLQGYLADQVRLTPHLGGGLDGFVAVYLATPVDRWGRSSRYRKGVKIGRVVGILCAVTIFLPVSAGRAVIGLLPGASRATRYVAKRWDAAKAKRKGLSDEAIDAASAQ